jgi:glycosyltransferase involved in cell wall biosynthesis
LKILTFTHLWPNPAEPNFGVFICNRMEAVSRRTSVRVVAPLPRGWRLLKRKYGWSPSAEIPASEMDGSMLVERPPHWFLPKLVRFNGALLARAMRSRFRSIQRVYDFDVIDAHWLYPDGYAAVRLGQEFHRPVMVTARGSDVNLFAARPDLRPKIEWTLKNADRLAAVSGALRKAMIALGAPPEKVDVLPNGVRAELFYPRSREQTRASTGLPPGGRVIGSVGTLTPGKNQELLIEAIARLRRLPEFHDVGAVIVGEGPSRARLEARIAALGLQEWVQLAGQRPNREIPEWLAAMDIFCLASLREGWPNVLFEALACGKPVVATSVGGVPEVLISDAYGLLVRSHDADALAAQLVAALRKRWDTTALIDYARAHTWESVAEQVLESLRRAQASAD